MRAPERPELLPSAELQFPRVVPSVVQTTDEATDTLHALTSGSLRPRSPEKKPLSVANGPVLDSPPQPFKPKHRKRNSSIYNISHAIGMTLANTSQSTRIRARSLSQSSQQAFKVVAPPVSVPLLALCLAWYATSAVSNNINKSILDRFPYPVTLSMVQFAMAVALGVSTIAAAHRSRSFFQMLPRGIVASDGLKAPSWSILKATIPMGCFQLSGHIFSHMSTTLLPVSLVHTIKSLSPLFTVAAYRTFFSVSYSPHTYLSLVPLTIGVIMTCATEFSAHFTGVLYALIATVIFVSQNMFSKKLLTPAAAGEDGAPKFDKLTILCYCSSLAFIFTFPVWFFSEGIDLLSEGASRVPHLAPTPLAAAQSIHNVSSTASLSMLFLTNGVVHFLQNLLAFQVLGMVSPVTYSVASLIKRIVVISVSIVWFGQRVSGIQGWGILLTFAGLYLYDRFGGDKHKKKTTVMMLPKYEMAKSEHRLD